MLSCLQLKIVDGLEHSDRFRCSLSPEGHLDEQIGERGLRKAISYAEFVGMRPRTMSQMHFRKEGRIVIFRDDKVVDYPERSVEKGEKGKKKGKGKGKLPLHLINIKDVDPSGKRHGISKMNHTKEVVDQIIEPSIRRLSPIW